MECKNCLLNSLEVGELELNSDGICNYCLSYRNEEKLYQFLNEGDSAKYDEIIQKLKNEGKGKKYDTILGVSGGVDSSYLALKLKESGLRVLLYHYDNGWDSELAVKNIQNLSEVLNFDLHTIVVDWNEFRDIQLAYLKAGVIDIEAITDHSAIFATKLVAKKFGIQNIVGGHNFVTESILPKSWIYPNKGDWYNFKDIHRKFGQMKLKSVPVDNLFYHLYFRYFYKIKWHYPLNYLKYEKNFVIQELESKIGWKNYGGKHYESVWTRFYQGYILPKRYGIDKRKAHLSNLICSGQITKQQANKLLEEPIYDPSLFKKDYEFVCKKFGVSESQFEELLSLPKKSHYDFDYQKPLKDRYPILKPLLKLRSIIIKK